MDSGKMAKPAAGGGDYASYLPVIDVAEGLRRVMNSKRLYFNLLNKFDIGQMITDLIHSMNAADFPEIIKHAHTIKGVAANLALNDLKKITEAIEKRAKNAEKCTDMINELEETAGRTAKLIGELLKNEAS